MTNQALNRFRENQPLTLEEAIRLGEQYLASFDLVYGHGTDNALDEAAWLLLEAMRLSPLEAPDYSQMLTEENKTRALEYLQKRAVQRIPVAYITGRTWFAGLEMLSDERALIPRSPLAEPLLEGFSDFLDPAQVHQVLDLCTGGGCIAIACAYAFADAQVDAVDLSPEALKLAQENTNLHAMQSRINLIQSDLFECIPEERQYDLIISNPPYVDQYDMSELGQEFLREPQLGLAAGKDGLAIVRRILVQAADYLTQDGLLICEVGNSAPAVEAAFPELPLLWLEFEHGGAGVFLITASDLRLGTCL